MIIWISFMCLCSIFTLYKYQNRTFILYVVYLCKYQGSHRCDLHNRLYHYISILLGCIFCFRTSTDVFHTCNSLADLYSKDILLGLSNVCGQMILHHIMTEYFLIKWLPLQSSSSLKSPQSSMPLHVKLWWMHFKFLHENSPIKHVPSGVMSDFLKIKRKITLKLRVYFVF